MKYPTIVLANRNDTNSVICEYKIVSNETPKKQNKKNHPCISYIL